MNYGSSKKRRIPLIKLFLLILFMSTVGDGFNIQSSPMTHDLLTTL